MKQQKRPFVVEIKQKRGLVKRLQSIWGGIDLAAIANDVAEATTEGAIAEAKPQPIFSGGEDIRSQPIPTTGEALSEVKHVIMPDASVAEPPTVEEGRVAEALNAPAGVRRTRRKKRSQEDVRLPRGERWKRRLPWVLRQSRRER
ncbi:hypothetical protein [Mesorhizobium sp.]|uniref:hypothetical protein n=1 Tax=Mesorhizobium sp. TaxID=1871066 RepID=UPI0025F33A28|nr:hypothetical protein [Mesorhizobium sp.]